MLDDLYQEIILEHARGATNRGALGNDALNVKVHNPLCGDEISLWVSHDGKTVTDVKFEGEGCMISQAAASLMTEQTRGRTFEEISQFIDDFSVFLQDSQDSAVNGLEDKLGELTVLEGVRKFPIRVRCALLAFEALAKIVTTIKEQQATE